MKYAILHIYIASMAVSCYAALTYLGYVNLLCPIVEQRPPPLLRSLEDTILKKDQTIDFNI